MEYFPITHLNASPSQIFQNRLLTTQLPVTRKKLGPKTHKNKKGDKAVVRSKKNYVINKIIQP